MQLISLTVLKRRGVAVNETQVIDVDSICSPISINDSGSKFLLNENYKAELDNVFNDTAAVVEYEVAESLTLLVTLAETLFEAEMLTYKGRPIAGAPVVLGFNANFIVGRIVDPIGPALSQ